MHAARGSLTREHLITRDTARRSLSISLAGAQHGCPLDRRQPAGRPELLLNYRPAHHRVARVQVKNHFAGKES
jgi:hypothetical protein